FSKPTIVSNVRTVDEEIVIADHRSRVVGPAAMDGHVLADSIVVADVQHSARIVDLKMLSFAADDGRFANLVIAAESRSRLDDSPRFELAIVANDGSRLNNTEGPDDYIATKLRA